LPEPCLTGRKSNVPSTKMKGNGRRVVMLETAVRRVPAGRLMQYPRGNAVCGERIEGEARWFVRGQTQRCMVCAVCWQGVVAAGHSGR